MLDILQDMRFRFSVIQPVWASGNADTKGYQCRRRRRRLRSKPTRMVKVNLAQVPKVSQTGLHPQPHDGKGISLPVLWTDDPACFYATEYNVGQVVWIYTCSDEVGGQYVGCLGDARDTDGVLEDVNTSAGSRADQRVVGVRVALWTMNAVHGKNGFVVDSSIRFRAYSYLFLAIFSASAFQPCLAMYSMTRMVMPKDAPEW